MPLRRLERECWNSECHRSEVRGPPSAWVTVWASVVILVCVSDCEITSGDHDPCDEGSALTQRPCPHAGWELPASACSFQLMGHRVLWSCLLRLRGDCPQDAFAGKSRGPSPHLVTNSCGSWQKAGTDL